MKCRIFGSIDSYDGVTSYNDWAKDRPLTKDVIIHTHMIASPKSAEFLFLIVAFFDEKMHPDW